MSRVFENKVLRKIFGAKEMKLQENGDAKRLGIRNSWTLSMDIQGWRKILEEARSQP